MSDSHPTQDPQEQNAVATGVYITIHGHFYQPPRENPYLNVIERQPSAYPFHDWNERILYECYRPNVFSRILNHQGEVVSIVNNFEYMSFNVGPTLMSWLAKHDEEVYQGIIEADRKSAERLNGHGNAIAQVFNHIIMPLANERDKYTQIRWGKADFRAHFGRDPEGMWLAETAVDYPTLEALANEEIRFIILAPSQAERCRPIPTDNTPDPDWLAVGGGQIDPTRPYRCFLPNGKHIDIFFYDGPISKGMGFDDVLSSSQNLADRFSQAVRIDDRPSQLICVATDGETFGHHKGGTEKCLSYAFTQEFAQRQWQVTNVAHYLSICPPTWEVVLKPVTAWSCMHGVDRWQHDCGCGGGGTWQQKWRRPLRDSLNWLRDRLADVYETHARKYLHDPWLARDEYIQVMHNRTPENTVHFLYRHQQHPLTESEQVDTLCLLEMQHQALLMFTSCGWFFDELSRPEGVQILRYAARAIELAGEVAGIQLEAEFRDRLRAAPSNVEQFRDGGRVYDELVVSSRITFERVAAHYAITSLFSRYNTEDRVYCYEATQLEYAKQRIGTQTLALGHLQLVSEITRECKEFTFAVLHLGGWDFHCCIQPFIGRLAYAQLKETLFDSIQQASVSQTMFSMMRVFGDRIFNLETLFAEERQWIIQKIADKSKTTLNQLYSQAYRDNYSIVRAFHREELPVPQELQVAADIALSHRCLQLLSELDVCEDCTEKESLLAELDSTVTEAHSMRSTLTLPGAKQLLEALILRSLQALLFSNASDSVIEDQHHIAKMIDVGDRLEVGLSLDRAQELYFRCFHEVIVPQCVETESGLTCPWDDSQMPLLLDLGKRLAVDVSTLL
jgi:alpha-amylase/alpha-mannosidase (GH57 family)